VHIYKASEKQTRAAPIDYRKHIRGTRTENSTSRDATAVQAYQQHIRKKSTEAGQQRKNQNVYPKI